MNEEEWREEKRREWQDHLFHLHSSSLESSPDAMDVDAKLDMISHFGSLARPMVSTDNAAFISLQNNEKPGRMTKKEILDKALEIVDGPRRESYGDPRDNHFRTALLWDAWICGTDRAITPKDVCVMNMLQKMSRGINNDFTDEELIDMVGYILNMRDLDD